MIHDHSLMRWSWGMRPTSAFRDM